MQNPIMALQNENIPEPPACISDSKSINSTDIPPVSGFQTALNATESTFVVPILILNPELWHKATWPRFSSPEDFCWLLHLNICRQKKRDSSSAGQQQAQNPGSRMCNKAKIKALHSSMEPRHSLPPGQQTGFKDCPLPKEVESSEDETKPNSFHSLIATVAGGRVSGKTSCAG